MGGPAEPYAQSLRTAVYADALARLEAAGLTYPCFCTRKELRLLAAAPHVDDAGAPYPGICRNLDAKQREALFRAGRKAAVRLRCAEERVDFVDVLLGSQSFCLGECGGDFALRRSDGVVAYQLAVAVDDALMGVNQVVRGRDILSSTPRQIVLLRLLGHAVPSYAHIPLLLDGEGQRLAKRHQSLSLRIVGLLARLAGLNPLGRPVRPAELLPDFALERLPGTDQRVTDQDLRQLAS